MDFKKLDPELWQAIANEEQRQQNNIELIASENIVSEERFRRSRKCID